MSFVDADQDAAERRRFESFSMPKAMPMSRPNMPAAQGSKRHSRSHSRNLSLSLAPNPLILPSAAPADHSPSPSPTPTTPNFKRGSHHKRLSSVSTRHESAEIMGVAIPDLPSSSQPGEKDCIRMRALLALEGKPDSFQEVEIPQLPTESSNRSFEAPLKPSFPAGSSLGSTSAFKRDSFKRLSTGPSNMDSLGTLLEEEEEEEPLDNEEDAAKPPSSAPPNVTSMEQKQSRPRPQLRPLSLTPETLHATNTDPVNSAWSAPPIKLKSLALANSFRDSPQSSLAASPSATEESESVQSHGSFRSSSSFRSPQSFRSSLGASDTDHSAQSFRNSPQSLRPLSLSLRSASDSIQTQGEDNQACEEVESFRYLQASNDAAHSNKSKRPGLTLDLSSRQAPIPRRSSISYKSSAHDGTSSMQAPTENRFSTSSSSSARSSISSSSNWFSHPTSAEPDSVTTPASSVAAFPSSAFKSRTSSIVSLSASEQHFLFKSHQSLLARIQDLERTLSVKRRESLGFGYDMQHGARSRPTSVASDASGESSMDPESYSLLAQITAERDELKKDSDGWRTRVAALEKQLGILGSRIDQERREAWVARSRIGLLDAEKASMEKLLLDARVTASDLEKKVQGLVDELGRCDLEKNSVIAENARLRERIGELEEEKENSLHAAVEGTPKVFTFSPSHRAPSLVSEDDSSTEIETPYDEDELSMSFEPSPTFGQEFGTRLDVVVEEENSVSHHHSQPTMKKTQNDVPECSYEEEEEDALAGYEDDDDDDELLADMTTSSGSSFGTSSNTTLDLRSASGTHSEPASSNMGGLSTGWTFPRLAAPTPVLATAACQERQDLFFDSFATDSSLDAESTPTSLYMDYSYEQSKGVFSLQAHQDDGFAFDLPDGVDAVERLQTVVEEEEDQESGYSETSDEASLGDDDVFGEIGGITITFTPADDDEGPSADSPQNLPVEPSEASPTSSSSSEGASPRETVMRVTRKPVPSYEEEEEDLTFTLPQMPRKPRPTSLSRLPRAIKPSPSSPPFSGRASPSPPAATRSFIPQRVGSPTRSPGPRRTSPPSPTFIRQPALSMVRKMVAPDNGSHPQPQLHRVDRFRPSRGGSADSPMNQNCTPSSMTSPLVSFLPSPTNARDFLTNFWSSSKIHTHAVQDPFSDDRNDSWNPKPSCSRPLVFNHKTRYVSKEQQLQKLKQRLDVEKGQQGITLSTGCAHCFGVTVTL